MDSRKIGPGRRKNDRRISYKPKADFFKPRGIPMMDLDEIEVTMEEMEAIRLVDLLDMDRGAAAERMGISRRSLSNDLRSARRKIADALVNSRALMIGGGSYTVGSISDGSDKLKPTGENMKIAIPADGETLDSRVDRRFARCSHFIIADMQTGETNAVKNEAASAGGGAGITASQNLIDMEVDAIISGNLGPKAHQTLEAAGIDMYIVDGVTVGEALDLYREDKLEKISGPNVGGHHGLR